MRRKDDAAPSEGDDDEDSGDEGLKRLPPSPVSEPEAEAEVATCSTPSGASVGLADRCCSRGSSKARFEIGDESGQVPQGATVAAAAAALAAPGAAAANAAAANLSTARLEPPVTTGRRSSSEGLPFSVPVGAEEQQDALKQLRRQMEEIFRETERRLATTRPPEDAREPREPSVATQPRPWPKVFPPTRATPRLVALATAPTTTASVAPDWGRAGENTGLASAAPLAAVSGCEEGENTDLEVDVSSCCSPSGAPTRQEDATQIPISSSTGPREPTMGTCDICGRCFNLAIVNLERHRAVCQGQTSSSPTSAGQPTLERSSRSAMPRLSSHARSSSSSFSPSPTGRAEHRARSEDARPTGVPTRLRSTGMRSPRSYTQLRPTSTSTWTLQPCPHCGRQFRPGPLYTHAKVCQGMSAATASVATASAGDGVLGAPCASPRQRSPQTKACQSMLSLPAPISLSGDGMFAASTVSPRRRWLQASCSSRELHTPGARERRPTDAAHGGAAALAEPVVPPYRTPNKERTSSAFSHSQRSASERVTCQSAPPRRFFQALETPCTRGVVDTPSTSSSTPVSSRISPGLQESQSQRFRLHQPGSLLQQPQQQLQQQRHSPHDGAAADPSSGSRLTLGAASPRTIVGSGATLGGSIGAGPRRIATDGCASVGSFCEGRSGRLEAARLRAKLGKEGRRTSDISLGPADLPVQASRRSLQTVPAQPPLLTSRSSVPSKLPSTGRPSTRATSTGSNTMPRSLRSSMPHAQPTASARAGKLLAPARPATQCARPATTMRGGGMASPRGAAARHRAAEENSQVFISAQGIWTEE